MSNSTTISTEWAQILADFLSLCVQAKAFEGQCRGHEDYNEMTCCAVHEHFRTEFTELAGKAEILKKKHGIDMLAGTGCFSEAYWEYLGITIPSVFKGVQFGIVKL